jgi:hypothetical protein
MNLPIVIVHQGLAEYLKLCLLKARQYNPSTPIVLIGNDENRCLTELIPGLTHVTPDFDDDDILLFQKNYKHRSVQTDASKKFEMICFLRWFFVRDFMKRNRIERCLHIDSDVLLFCDVWQVGEAFSKYGMTLAPWGDKDDNNLIGHTCFINDRQLLDRFCDMLQEYFSNPEKSRFLDDMYADFINNKVCRFAITDMTMLKIFHDENPQLIGNVSDIVNLTTFDNRITSCEGGYVANTRLIKKEMKKILFENKIPYCWNHALQENIRFHSVHFHGSTKYMMKYFFHEEFTYYGALLRERIALKWQKVFR